MEAVEWMVNRTMNGVQSLSSLPPNDATAEDMWRYLTYRDAAVFRLGQHSMAAEMGEGVDQSGVGWTSKYSQRQQFPLPPIPAPEAFMVSKNRGYIRSNTPTSSARSDTTANLTASGDGPESVDMDPPSLAFRDGKTRSRSQVRRKNNRDLGTSLNQEKLNRARDKIQFTYEDYRLKDSSSGHRARASSRRRDTPEERRRRQVDAANMKAAAALRSSANPDRYKCKWNKTRIIPAGYEEEDSEEEWEPLDGVFGAPGPVDDWAEEAVVEEDWDGTRGRDAQRAQPEEVFQESGSKPEEESQFSDADSYSSSRGPPVLPALPPLVVEAQAALRTRIKRSSSEDEGFFTFGQNSGPTTNNQELWERTERLRLQDRIERDRMKKGLKETYNPSPSSSRDLQGNPWEPEQVFPVSDAETQGGDWNRSVTPAVPLRMIQGTSSVFAEDSGPPNYYLDAQAADFMQAAAVFQKYGKVTMQGTVTVGRDGIEVRPRTSRWPH